MSNNPYQPIAGKTFKEDSYEYRIYVKTGDIGDDYIISISVFLENIPDIIGMDLIQKAVAHVSALTPEELKNNAQFMVNKVVMEEYESLGEISRSLLKGISLGLQPLDSLIHVIERNLDNKIDFHEINQRITSRKLKLQKSVDYLQRLLPALNEKFKEYQVKKINATINGAPTKSSEGMIRPGINIRLVMDYTSDNNFRLWDAKDAFKGLFLHYSLIDLYSYDKLDIDFNKIK